MNSRQSDRQSFADTPLRGAAAFGYSYGRKEFSQANRNAKVMVTDNVIVTLRELLPHDWQVRSHKRLNTEHEIFVWATAS